MSWKEKFPEEMIKGREQVEASFVFCLWKNPELFSDYEPLNINGDESIKTEDGQFYFSLGRQLAKAGFRSFDHVTVHSFLEDKPTIKKRFENYGGMKTVNELKNLVDPDNVEAYYDKLVKGNMLLSLHEKGFNVLSNLQLFSNMTSEQVYDYFDYQLNDISINASHDVEIESLIIDDDFIKRCNEGSAIGLGYGERCPILNYMTLGVPLGNMFMIGGHSGTGKSSFVFENMLLSFNNKGIKTAILSNEMRSDEFKNMLLAHILTRELDFWELTRKKLKMGNYTPKQLEMIKKAQKISREKYGNLKFAKLFDNEMGRITKITKKLAKRGYQAIFYDTMKSEDEIDGTMWQQLLLQSRRLFQLASRENIALVVTYQLALHTLKQRFLDASCLSNAKQIKEVFSEMVYFRPLWEDEHTNEKRDVKPYQYERDKTGKFTKIRKPLETDPNKDYLVVFLDKTRNDSSRQTLLYEFNGQFNRWHEVGYCTVFHDRG